MQGKVCNKCKIEKPIEMFCRNKNSKDGLNHYCKECTKQAMREWRSNNKEHEKQYAIDNKEKTKARSKRYYENNKEKVLEKSRVWDEQNKEKRAKQKKKYRKDNKERLSEYARQYQIENKTIINIKNNRYRAKKRKLEHSLTVKQWEQIKKIFNNKCAYCGAELPLEQEHFVPVSLGGEYTYNNIIPACRSCNASKNNTDFFKWYVSQDFFSEERANKILEHLGAS